MAVKVEEKKDKSKKIDRRKVRKIHSPAKKGKSSFALIRAIRG